MSNRKPKPPFWEVPRPCSAADVDRDMRQRLQGLGDLLAVEGLPLDLVLRAEDETTVLADLCVAMLMPEEQEALIERMARDPRCHEIWRLRRENKRLADALIAKHEERAHG